MWGATGAVKAVVVRLVGWVYSRMAAIVCGAAPKAVPTMKSSILMESGSCLAGRIRSRKVTSVEVVRTYVERIREVNGVVNCVAEERFEAALTEAEEADARIRSGGETAEELEKESPFLGVPFSSPGGVEVATGLMKAGGGIPIASTNASEGRLLWETQNPVIGRTCNPYDTNRSVGGPYGGEACLIAACGSPMGIAPSGTLSCAFNGIFGHKPSEEASCEAAGPMSRNSEDLLPLLRILTRNSGADLRLDDAVDLKSVKYYFMDEDGGGLLTSPVDEEIKEAIQKAAHHFRNTVNAFVERVDLRQMSKAYPIWRARHGSEEGHRLNLCKEIVMALLGKSRHTLAFLLASLADRIMQSHGDYEKDRTLLLKTFQDMLASDGVFIYPTHPVPALRHNDSIASPLDFGYSAIFDALGLPATHCPTGLHSNGLPIGFQVVAALNRDRLTIAVAREIDRAFCGWTPPPTRSTFTLKNSLFHTASDEKLKVL